MVCRAEQWDADKDTHMAAFEEDGLKRASADLRWPLGRYVFRHAGHRNCASRPYDTGPGHSHLRSHRPHKLYIPFMRFFSTASQVPADESGTASCPQNLFARLCTTSRAGWASN